MSGNKKKPDIPFNLARPSIMCKRWRYTRRLKPEVRPMRVFDWRSFKNILVIKYIKDLLLSGKESGAANLTCLSDKKKKHRKRHVFNASSMVRVTGVEPAAS